MPNAAKKEDVKKHVAAIHCANSLSLLQRKISNALLYHAYYDLMDQEEHEISIAHLCQLIGYSGNNVAKIKEALKALISTVIEWNLVDDCGGEDWTACSILAGARIRKGKCTYSYYVGLRELLHSPSIYGRINLIVQARFNSNYGLALYENCARYVGLPKTKCFDLDLFRRLMGVPKDKYLVFRDFKKRVLDKAVDEVNTHSDIMIEPIINRAGRKVQSIQFTLETRSKKKRLGEGESKASGPLYQRLTADFHVDAKQAKKIVDTYPDPYILQKMDIAQQNQATIHNVAGFLINALKDDYKPVVSGHTLKAEAEQQAWQVESKEKQKQKVQEAEQQAYHYYCQQQILQQLKLLPEQKQQYIVQGFQEQLPKTFHKSFKEQGLENKMLLALFKNYALTEYNEDFELPSEQQYLELVD